MMAYLEIRKGVIDITGYNEIEMGWRPRSNMREIWDDSLILRMRKSWVVGRGILRIRNILWNLIVVW